MGEKKIRSAVIGYGGAFNMGKSHANQMREVGIEFVAACDLDPLRMEQAAKDFPEIRTYTNVKELLAQSDIDLITVITPHNTHADLAMQVLEAGKHCILEKPMTIHADDANALVKTAKAKGLMVTTYHNRRWDAWNLTVQNVIQKEILGEIFQVEMFFGGYGRPGEWWRSNKEVSGGALYDWGAHFTDWLLGIVPGKMKSIRGFTQNRLWNHVTNEDHVDSIIQFENGAIAQLTISSIARLKKPHVRILGTNGAVIQNAIGEDHLILQTEINGLQVETKVPHVKANPIAFYKNIAAHLLNGEELIVKPEQARRVIAVLDTTCKSAEEGRELPVPFEHET